MPQIIHKTKLTLWDKIKGRQSVQCIHMTDGTIHWRMPDSSWKKNQRKCATVENP